MSFLKFWGKKDKKDSSDSRREDYHNDADAEKRKLRHSLSISRSGRFKQKKRERGQILDQPELFNGQGAAGKRQQDEISQSSASSTTSTGSSDTSQSASSPTYRSARPNMAASGNLRMGPSVVT